MKRKEPKPKKGNNNQPGNRENLKRQNGKKKDK